MAGLEARGAGSQGTAATIAFPSRAEIGTRLPQPELPLSVLIPPPWERGRMNLGAQIVAEHELRHALAGIGLGAEVNLLGISLKPEGKSLARTYFSGLLNFDQHKIIAAAGAARSPLGSPSGFGNDMSQIDAIDLLEMKPVGSSRSSSISSAESKLSNYPDALRERAAEILAYLGIKMDFIPASIISDILARAEVELMMEKTGLTDKIVPAEIAYEKIKIPKQHTIIQREKMLVRVIWVNGDKKTEKLICPFCGGENGGHAYYCKMGKGDTLKPTQRAEKKLFPLYATIFPKFSLN